jgi:zinc transport system ATP-binding protein
MHLPQPKIIELNNVSLTFDNGHSPFQNINFHVDEGDFVAITGPNGGGKTSLLRLILKLIAPTSGKVTYRWKGNEVKHLNFGYLPQKNTIDHRFPITVKEVISSGLNSTGKLFHRLTNDEKEKIQQTINLVGLCEKADAGIGEISGGQLQRALLGRAIISNPNVLILDEPLSYVDKNFESHLYEIISDLAKHTTIVLVSHEMTKISQLANRHIIIDGSIHECHAKHHFVRSDCK